jgi:hypothetical protein
MGQNANDDALRCCGPPIVLCHNMVYPHNAQFIRKGQCDQKDAAASPLLGPGG